MDRAVKFLQTAAAVVIVFLLAGVTFDIIAGAVFWICVLLIVAALVFMVRILLKRFLG